MQWLLSLAWSIYIYIILSRINRTTMNLLLKVSRFFHDLQVNVLPEDRERNVKLLSSKFVVVSCSIYST